MFLNKICVATILLFIHAANSYILLTANLDDVHALAKQIAASPVAHQLDKIFRRASNVFNQHYSQENRGLIQKSYVESDQIDGNSKQRSQMRNDPMDKDSRQQPQMKNDPTDEYSRQKSYMKSDPSNGDLKQKSQKRSNPTGGDSRERPQMRSDPTLDDEPDYLNKEKDFRYADSDVDTALGSKKDVPLLNDDDPVEVWQPDTKVMEEELNAKMPDDTSNEYSDEDVGKKSNRVERRRHMGPDLVALGKNASFYLKSIKKIFENV
ncbi:uncharacterized protein LOC111354500 [Spodoptera litura]|uniref:Uncharacterized protein LOC111354500 n=1 Tax=Spodoptera litura TaxID=69820 RepID=A0A9J7IQA9_SPOLT|nr:uncharacterized protein LOC111354500 [Spodoptera litura]